jgi:hypothetical protein
MNDGFSMSHKRSKLQEILTILLTTLMFISGYAFLRYAFKISDSFPFTQEIALIFLGTLATVLITALLLRKQSEVELEKEKTVKYLDLKSNIYLEVIHELEELLSRRDLSDEQLMKLEFLAHKVAIIASPGFLKAYGQFLQDIQRYLTDNQLTDKESDLISERMSLLTVEMRKDLVGELDEEAEVSQSSIKRTILKNIRESVTTF